MRVNVGSRRGATDAQVFEKWIVIYVYESGDDQSRHFPSQAIALENLGSMVQPKIGKKVASARTRSTWQPFDETGPARTIEVEEEHLKDDRLLYKGRMTLTYPVLVTSAKVTEISGRKENDYFAYWPAYEMDAFSSSANFTTYFDDTRPHAALQELVTHPTEEDAARLPGYAPVLTSKIVESADFLKWAGTELSRIRDTNNVSR
jgi:hypothetical protein